MVASVEIEDFYPYSYQPQVRYGYGKPFHAILEAVLAKGFFRYESLLQEFLQFSDDFLQIRKDLDPVNPSLPFWLNPFLPGLDAIALYGMIASKKPKLFYEIGSGNSTKFASAARKKYNEGMQIVSIDPQPRAEVDQLCNKVIRKPLQECDLSIFHSLQAGDILFFDGSHRTLQNSDVTVFFLEVLPRLKSGVLIHLHDILLPADYPPHWTKRMYSEQYLLSVLLMADEANIEVILPNAYISFQEKLMPIFQQIWNAPHLGGIKPFGSSFWFSLKEQRF